MPRCHRAGGQYEQVGGVAPVRRRDADGARRAAARGPVRDEPGGVPGWRVHFAESCCIVALADHPGRHEGRLSLVEGLTENAWLVTELLVDLRERWLDVTRPVLAVLDGSKAALRR